MGMIDDILKALDRIPVWKRVQALPAEHEALAARVAALEERLAPATGTACPACREMRLKLISSEPHSTFGDLGAMEDSYQCSACNYTDKRMRDSLKP